MKVHYLQHVPFEGPAFINTIADKNRIEISGTELYNNQDLPDINNFDILVVMGGPMGVYDDEKYPWLKMEKKFIEQTISKDKKVIGICLGAQLIADVMGAKVFENKHKEIGWFPLMKTAASDNSKITSQLPDKFYAFHWHGDTFDIPSGAKHLCKSEACENQAFIYNERVLALQFHLESTIESVELLLKNCAHELDESRFIQSSSLIKEQMYIEDSNLLMENIFKSMI